MVTCKFCTRMDVEVYSRAAGVTVLKVLQQ